MNGDIAPNKMCFNAMLVYYLEADTLQTDKPGSTTVFGHILPYLPFFILRAHLPQASASILRQLCDDVSDSVLIENNGVT